MTVYAWGAGGGNSGTGTGANSVPMVTWPGGAGGYTSATFAVTTGSTYKVIVGRGGDFSSSIGTDPPTHSTQSYGGGMNTGNLAGDTNWRNASGGGRSAVLSGTTEILTAGGGGGAGKTNNDSSKATDRTGGAGGGSTGGDAQGNVGYGRGGTQTAGGAGGGGTGTYAGASGGSLIGGAGSMYAAGGGGGYYGGGGGSFVYINPGGICGGGGGGSSFIHSSKLATPAPIMDQANANGTISTAAAAKLVELGIAADSIGNGALKVASNRTNGEIISTDAGDLRTGRSGRNGMVVIVFSAA